MVMMMAMIAKKTKLNMNVTVCKDEAVVHILYVAISRVYLIECVSVDPLKLLYTNKRQSIKIYFLSNSLTQNYNVLNTSTQKAAREVL